MGEIQHKGRYFAGYPKGLIFYFFPGRSLMSKNPTKMLTAFKLIARITRILGKRDPMGEGGILPTRKENGPMRNLPASQPGKGKINLLRKRTFLHSALDEGFKSNPNRFFSSVSNIF
jgi:hypothetical protein